MNFFGLNAVDLVLALILAAFSFWGYHRGFVEMLAQFLAAIIAFAVGWRLSGPVAAWIAGALHWNPSFLQLVIFILLFVLLERGLGFVFMLIAKALKLVTMLPLVSCTNALLGAVFGFLEGIVLIGSTVHLLLTLHLNASLTNALASSSVAHIILKAFYPVLGFLL